MDPKIRHPMMLAPGASSSPRQAPGAPSQWPRIDDHLVPPEISGAEVVRGQRYETMGANAEHADPHCQLDALLFHHVAPGYVAATDLQTRFTVGSDFAPDTSIRRVGRDERTGTRYLEEIAFEIVNEQHVTGPRGASTKAEEMLSRGVRRVFGIFVKERAVKEWVGGGWQTVPHDGSISDPCLATPVPVRAILDAAETKNAVARALLAQGNPEITRQRIGDICEALGIEQTPERRAHLLRLDGDGLASLLAHLKAHRAWPGEGACGAPARSPPSSCSVRLPPASGPAGAAGTRCPRWRRASSTWPSSTSARSGTVAGAGRTTRAACTWSAPYPACTPPTWRAWPRARTRTR
jgi:hypothetical protein